MYETDASQPSAPNQLIHDALWRGSGGWEIAAGPVVFGLIGWLIDGVIGTRPVFTVILAIVGLGGAFANVYFSYTRRMAEVTAERSVALEHKSITDSGSRFGRVEQVELPSYVLEGDTTPEGAQ